MANKTVATTASVPDYLAGIANPQRRADCEAVMAIMARVSGEPAVMWGASMIGFGSYHYRYESGREGDMFLTGVAPRAQALSVYIMDGFEPHAQDIARLGKHKTGRSCLYVRKLEDIDLDVLETIITHSVATMRSRYNV